MIPLFSFLDIPESKKITLDHPCRVCGNEDGYIFKSSDVHASKTYCCSCHSWQKHNSKAFTRDAEKKGLIIEGVQ